MQSSYSELFREYWPVVTTIVAAMWAVWERSGKKRSELKLKEAERRGDAPDLICGRFVAHRPGNEAAYFRNPESQATFLESVLSGDEFCVRMDLINQGQKVKRAAIINNPAYLLRTINGELHTGDAKAAIVYDYDFGRSGDPVEFVIEFESYTGFQQRHRYRHEHGRPILKRIDPL